MNVAFGAYRSYLSACPRLTTRLTCLHQMLTNP